MSKAKLGQLHLQNQYLHQLIASEMLTLASISKPYQECDGDSDEFRKLLQLTAAADTTVILQISHSINNRSTETFIFPDEIQSHVIYRNCVIRQKMANKNPLCDYAHHI